MDTNTLVDVISAVLLLGGGLLAALGGIGMLRFPDLLSRLHAAAKPQALGIVLVLLGSAPHWGGWVEAAPVLFVIAVHLTSAPIVAGAIGRLAHRSGQYRPELLIVDELRAAGEEAHDR